MEEHDAKDRELLIAAATAAGYECRSGHVFQIFDDGNWWNWAPLKSNADAFLLAIKLGLNIVKRPDNTVEVTVTSTNYDEFIGIRESYESDPVPAARLAIVKVAAMLAKRESILMNKKMEPKITNQPLIQSDSEIVASLAWALSMVLDGTQNHDIQNKTGLSDEDLEKVIAAREIADKMVFGK